MTNEIKNTQLPPAEDEIDLIALAKTIWDSRKFIINTVIVFIFLGVAVALLTPKEYTASSTLVPQVSSGSSSKMGGLSSLAAMAGFSLNMDNTTQDLSPLVYPQIIQSVPFQLELMNTLFTFSDVDHPVSLFEYYTEYAKPGILGSIKKYTIGLPFVILKAVQGEQPEVAITKNDGTFNITKEQEKIRKMLAASISLNPDDKNGIVVLSSTFQEAQLAAQVARKSQELLQQYITEFKIKKASAQLDFIQERYEEKKKEFEKAQAALAEFSDRNKNVTSALARTQEEWLQSDYQLAFNVYSELAKQLEQAQIQVKEDTPVFAVIKPVTVPLEDNNSGFMTLIIWTFLGGVIAIGWIFGKQFLATVKEKWNQTEVPEQ